MGLPSWEKFEGRNGVRVLGYEILGEGCGVTLQVGRQVSVQVAGDLMHSFSLPSMQDVDKWSFDVFSLNEASGDHALKFIFYELLTRYDLISRFKVSAYF